MFWSLTASFLQASDQELFFACTVAHLNFAGARIEAMLVLATFEWTLVNNDCFLVPYSLDITLPSFISPPPSVLHEFAPKVYLSPI